MRLGTTTEWWWAAVPYPASVETFEGTLLMSTKGTYRADCHSFFCSTMMRSVLMWSRGLEGQKPACSWRCLGSRMLLSRSLSTLLAVLSNVITHQLEHWFSFVQISLDCFDWRRTPSRFHPCRLFDFSFRQRVGVEDSAQFKNIKGAVLTTTKKHNKFTLEIMPEPSPMTANGNSSPVTPR